MTAWVPDARFGAYLGTVWLELGLLLQRQARRCFVRSIFMIECQVADIIEPYRAGISTQVRPPGNDAVEVAGWGVGVNSE